MKNVVQILLTLGLVILPMGKIFAEQQTTNYWEKTPDNEKVLTFTDEGIKYGFVYGFSERFDEFMVTVFRGRTVIYLNKEIYCPLAFWQAIKEGVGEPGDNGIDAINPKPFANLCKD